ncbi:unnamed protein product [Symbiodinium necroappetens]|uniref:Uncharacterized protein n=1 Tax=Symbiodinium necroappetens TaxID=1628268 RepID=A0A812RNQ6_9DINO|nr:unnamed protein product [Symbiodinium necroappetens]
MADVIPPQESYIRRPKEVRAHLQKSRAQRSRNFAVVDSTGSWMERWRNQFDALAIPFLRSHEMMHPDAFDHSTLSVWAAAKSRNDFLFLENLPKDKAYHGPFVLPSNRMMLDFCRDLVKLGGLDRRIWPAHAESMRPSACGSGIEVSLRTAEDTLQTVLAKHVVVARGPTWRRQWPAFYKLLDAAALAEIRHTWDLFDKPEQVAALRGRGIIVGGGLSSAHLCTQLAGRGHIDLLIRRERKVKQYDLGLSWMGWKRREQRREYEQAPIEERLAKNRAARDGGSVSPELDAEVSQLEAKGLVTVHEWTEIATASFDGSWTVALSTGDVMEADYLICATGALVDAATDPLLSGLQEVHPLPMHGGLPAVTYNLQWGKLPVYLMGNLAALELGPDAVNMTGAARGDSLMGHGDPADAGQLRGRLLCSLHDECFGYSRDGPLRGMNPRACLLWTQSGLTGHGHGGGLWSCATKILAAEPRNCTSSAPVMKDGIPVEMAPEIWCGCSGAFSRGPWGLVSVIAEQFATFYCELGMIAPMLIGLAGFAIHSFTCSQAVAHLNVLEAQETHRQLVAVGQQGRAVVEEGDQQTNTAMVAWHEARRENLPKPLATLGTSRMFSV